jgi:hypothetical protein
LFYNLSYGANVIKICPKYTNVRNKLVFFVASISNDKLSVTQTISNIILNLVHFVVQLKSDMGVQQTTLLGQFVEDMKAAS